MDAIVNFFSNSWIVSIITGLLVYFLTKIWESIRAKRQYMQAVKLANKEVFNTIKLCVPEDTLPDVYVLRALHASTAKSYNVKEESMDSLNLIIFDLIKEIMDSSFLAYENKMNYCRKLKSLEQNLNNDDDNSIDLQEGKSKGEKDELRIFGWLPLMSYNSFILSVIGGVITFIISSNPTGFFDDLLSLNLGRNIFEEFMLFVSFAALAFSILFIKSKK